MKDAMVAAALATVALAACGSASSGITSSADIGPRFGPTPFDSSVCYSRSFNVYFDDAQSNLTPEARQAIAFVNDALARCRIANVRVIGLVDPPADSSENIALSEQRARTLAAYLLHHTNWPRSAYELVGRDQTQAPPAGVAQPLRRRARIDVGAAPPD